MTESVPWLQTLPVAFQELQDEDELTPKDERLVDLPPAQSHQHIINENVK